MACLFTPPDLPERRITGRAGLTKGRIIESVLNLNAVQEELACTIFFNSISE